MRHSIPRTRNQKQVRVIMPKKKAPTNKALNNKIKNIQNNLIELKYQDAFNGGSTITPAGLLINSMNFTSNSAGSIPVRDGLDIVASSLTMKAYILADPDQLVGSRVRCVVFWDRQPNGADAVLLGDNGLLDNTVVTDPTLSPRNYKTIDRYKILEDFNIVLNPQMAATEAAGAVTTVIPMEAHFNKYYKLSRTIKYDGTANDITDLVTNSMNVAYFTDLVTNQPLLTQGTRMYYKD